MPLLEVDRLAVTHHRRSLAFRGRKETEVIRDVSFEIGEGETVGLLGESGSGKTTIARCVLGLTQGEGGEIRYRGTNIFPRTENRRLFSTELQMIFQGGSASLDPRMTASSAVMEAIDARGVSVSREELRNSVESLFTLVGLPSSVGDRYPAQLSGGQKQRVAIARALAVHPSLLVLDEPTSALDVLTQSRILSMLTQIQREQGVSMLLITHDVETALAYCDRIMLLHEGTIVEQGTVHQFLNSPVHPATRQLLADCRLLH